MKQYQTTVLALLLLVQPAAAQRVGEWTTHLAVYDTKSIAEAAGRVYAVADGTLYSYGKDDNSVTVHTKKNGLSDTEISMIDYHPDSKTLLIVYSNGNIDLMSEDGLYNLPFLKEATNIQDKTVNGINFEGENAYLSTAFGIMVIKMSKKEISETYRLNVNTYAVCLRGGTILAATASGLLEASVGDNLLDNHNWRTVPLPATDFKAENIRRLCVFQDMVCFLADNAGVFFMDAGGEIKTLVRHTGLRSMKLQAGRLILHTASTMYVYESLAQYESANLGTVNDVSSLKDDGNYWIAAGTGGLAGIRRTADGQFEPFVSGLNTEGPKRNLSQFLTFRDGTLWVAGGGRSKTDRYHNPGTLATCRDGKWFNFDESAVNRAVGYACQDYTAIVTDPEDGTHFFVATCGEGVLEFRNNEFAQLYNHTNSALQTILSGNNHYIRTQGLCYDRDKNLWITNSQVDNGIVVRKPDGTWVSLYYPGIANAYFVDQIMITSKGYKWVNVPHSNASTGILVFDDRGTPYDNSDDVSYYFTSFKSGTGAAIESGGYYCMTEDLKGEVWIGTDIGPIYCPSPNRAIENPDNLYCNRIVRTDGNGENYYFLSGEQINAIAVDGGNRKWIGTANSGVFLVSPDGMETIHQFTVDNSPLYSNNVRSIAIDRQTGEVFIGTDKGLISYRGEATEASESYSDVYAYPNPVRPEYDGQVVVTGLMNDSNVKITDLNGNLIYQGRSAGGQFSWNCRNRSGNRVATGIYLVLASTPGAGESVVTKIAVVK
ncbi:MAG: hypothetical protein LBS42_10870 [Tannerella sp.]|jgi:sugar lactone lactonase YvrE|nr:hypothetical protein [Tannerella sp.]